MFTIVLYVFFIVLADVLAAKWIIPIGFGLFVPAGVFAIAPIFTLRDDLHRKYGAKVVTLLVLLGSLVSYVISILLGNDLLGRVTIASFIAFLISENVDTLIYHFVKHQSWMNRVLKSNAISSLLDSVIFIGLAFGLILPLIIGQYLVKMILATIVGVFLRRQHNGKN